ncbi:hypothetical protein CH63R_00854 [Colletotrichum higginsianum IMI 349063]|uniref:Uncharacterized protein n=1 Tax=Colletotrichum higginsianum (strain IMI 349063) TaxID=759273 RepID=A0A1B7YUR1_COLHI|nr:hypothetical protein CH63R_00854 [Colletotrichum higginsianum IMI 349063]OBR15674.1 hypothetical protein CH63R_00854 [Colletotrichum higginsianum IMI 349063]
MASPPDPAPATTPAPATAPALEQNQPPDQQTTSATPARPERRPRAGGLLPALAIALVSWLLIGSISHSPPAIAALGDGIIALDVALVFVQIPMLFLALDSASDLWPGRGSATFTAAVVGLGVASAYALRAADGWANGSQGLFWTLGGMYGGVALEWLTGFWARLERRLERSATRGDGTPMQTAAVKTSQSGQ